MFASCYTFAFICCVYDFMVELKSKRKWNEFQLFLYLSQRIPARSAVESSARSALTEGSDSLTLFSFTQEVELGYRSRARSAQAKEESQGCELE
jgi:hypothetical protein